MTFHTVVLAAARWAELAGLLGFIGALTIRNVNRYPPVMQWARPPFQHTLAVALVGGVGTLVAGGFEFAVAVRVIAEGAAVAMSLTIGRGVVPSAIVAIFLLPFSSHATSVNPFFAGYFVDLMHVIAAGQWAGGIAALAILRPPGGWRGEEGRELLRRFGGLALIAFAALAITGLIQAAEQLRQVSDLWTTAYGLVLAAKTAGALGMVAMSAVTWRRGVPLARAEAAVAIAVVAVSALLVAFPNTPTQA